MTVVLVLGAGGAAFALFGREETPKPEQPPVPGPVQPTPGPGPAPVGPAPVGPGTRVVEQGPMQDGPGPGELPPARPVGMVAPGANAASYPNGTQVPLLNGVTEPIAIPWPAALPWSPIKGVVPQAGNDWYLHEDGSWSTTLLQKEPGTGRLRGVAEVFPAVPQAQQPADPRRIPGRPVPQVMHDR